MKKFRGKGYHAVIFNAIGHTVNKAEGQAEFWTFDAKIKYDVIEPIFAVQQRKANAEQSRNYILNMSGLLRSVIYNTGSRLTVMSNINETKKLSNAWTVVFGDSVVVDIGGGSFSFKQRGETIRGGKVRDPQAIANEILNIEDEGEAQAACEAFVGLILGTADQLNLEDYELRQTGQMREIFFSREYQEFVAGLAVEAAAAGGGGAAAAAAALPIAS